MKEIIVSIDQFKMDYPKVYEQMIKELIFAKNSFKLEELNFYYCWTILPIHEDDKELIEAEYNKQNLTFEDRLEHESSKLGVEIYINYDNYIRGYVTEDEEIPEIILEDLARFIISTMRYEQNFYLDKKVIDSIPNDIQTYIEIDTLLAPKLLESNLEEYDNLDDILDKINKYGIDSLTDNERNILDNISNN